MSVVLLAFSPTFFSTWGCTCASSLLNWGLTQIMIHHWRLGITSLSLNPSIPRCNFLLPTRSHDPDSSTSQAAYTHLMPQNTSIALISSVEIDYAFLLPSVLCSVGNTLTMISLRNGEMECGRQLKGVEWRGSWWRKEYGIYWRMLRQLRHDKIVPWAALTQLQTPKFFSDTIESVLGTIVLESHGDIDIVRETIIRLNILPVLERIVKDKADVWHPVSRIAQ